jgi:hypothetical protein
MKIPDCDRCSLYAHNPHLVCAVHPDGVNSDLIFNLLSLILLLVFRCYFHPDQYLFSLALTGN